MPPDLFLSSHPRCNLLILLSAQSDQILSQKACGLGGCFCPSIETVMRLSAFTIFTGWIGDLPVGAKAAF